MFASRAGTDRKAFISRPEHRKSDGGLGTSHPANALKGYGSMSRIDFEGRVAVVTGAANGIGFAATERIIASGGQAVLGDVDSSAIESALAKLDDGARGRVVELTDQTSLEAATIEAKRVSGKIDVLINNDGSTSGNGKTWELGPDVWRRTIEVNRVAP